MFVPVLFIGSSTFSSRLVPCLFGVESLSYPLNTAWVDADFRAKKRTWGSRLGWTSAVTDFWSEGSGWTRAGEGPQLSEPAAGRLGQLLLGTPCTVCYLARAERCRAHIPFPAQRVLSWGEVSTLSQEHRRQDTACLRVGLCGVDPIGSVRAASFLAFLLEGVGVGREQQDMGWRRWSWKGSWGAGERKGAVDRRGVEQGPGGPGTGADLHPSRTDA